MSQQQVSPGLSEMCIGDGPFAVVCEIAKTAIVVLLFKIVSPERTQLFRMKDPGEHSNTRNRTSM